MSNYSTDADLASYYPDIMELLPQGQIDFDAQHALAAERIDVALKSRGVDPEAVTFTDDVKHAACGYVLFLVFTAASVTPQDTYASLAGHWLREHNRTLSALYWEEDDGDGVVAQSEQRGLRTTRFERS